MTQTSITMTQTQQRKLIAAAYSWWASRSKVEWAFLGLALLRLLIVLVFMLDWLPLERRFGWYLQHGGDQNEFLRLAISMIEGGDLYITIVAIGPALLYIPWIMLLYEGAFGGEYLAQIYFTIAPALVVINGFILGSLSVVVFGVLSRRLTKNDIVAVAATAIWAVLPLLTYFAFFWHPENSLVRSANVPKVGWLNGLSDGPATFFIMLAVMLLAMSLRDDKQMPIWRIVAFGAALGSAMTFRVHIGLFVVVLLGYVVIAHGWRTLPWLVLGAAITYLPQAWYNILQFNIPVTTGYISAHYLLAQEYNQAHMGLLQRLPFGPSHLLELFQYHVGRRPWLVLPVLASAVTAFTVIYITWKTLGWRQVVLMIILPFAYLLPMMATWPFRDDVIRFSMPAFPYLILMFVYFGWLARDFVRRRQAQVNLNTLLTS